MLNGSTVLVVEEEFLIALDIQRMLENLNVGQVVFARSVDEAQGFKEHWAGVRLAIVEVTLQRHHSFSLIATLQSLGICVVLSSADGSLRHGIEQFPTLPVVLKPMAEHDLVQAIGLAISPLV